MMSRGLSGAPPKGCSHGAPTTLLGSNKSHKHNSRSHLQDPESCARFLT